MWPSGSVTHYNIPSYTGQVHYNVTNWAGNHYNVTIWAGNPLQYTILYTMWPTGQVTHYNVTIWAGNPLQYTILYWAGNPLQYTITKKKNPRIFQSLGRSPGTIRPLVKFFAFLLSSGRLPRTIWFISKKKKGFFLYLLSFINLLHKAKRKWYFLISLHSKYYKEGATVITQFFFDLFVLIILFF
jgi:hypothetical protein